MIQKILLAITFGIAFVSAFGQKGSFTPSELALLKKINFKNELIAEIRGSITSNLRQLPAIDQETGEVINSKYVDGICLEASESKAIEIVKELKSKFRSNGYLIFEFESEGEDNKKYVAVIKGTDDLDILRYRRTDGINYGLENKDIVKKIAEWKTKYGVQVLGCGRDWLQVEFNKLPADLNVFAKEVYKFCPDSVDQGVGTVEKLKDTIKEMKELWLWWD